MRVLFIYTREFSQSPSKPLVDFEAIQFGISFISSFLKSHGHETRLLLLTRDGDFSLIDRFMKDFSPQLVCFTAVASEYLFVEKIGKYVKERYPEKFLLIGGVHVSLVTDDSMLDTFDALCVGEGEGPTLELIKQLEQGAAPSGISNLWIKKGAVIEKNPTRRFIADINALPYPDRGMWDEWIDMERSTKRPSLLLGRGCPFTCTYCSNHAFKKLSDGPYVRFRSPENIVGEIEAIVSRYPTVEEFYLEVETFGAKMAWALEVCAALEAFNKKRSGAPIRFGVNLRVTPKLTEKLETLFEALEKSNFRFVNIGLESGSERVREEILKRHYSNDDIIEAVRIARRHGLKVSFFNLIGLPHETVADFNETIRVNRICLPDYHNLSIFYPYPGTDLYKLCKEGGFLPPDLLFSDKERVAAAMEFPEFSRRQIQKGFIWFDYYVHKGHWPEEQLTGHTISMYQLVYGGQSKARIFFQILRDVLSPSLKFSKEYKEHELLLSVLKFIMSRFAPRSVFRAVMRGLGWITPVFVKRALNYLIDRFFYFIKVKKDKNAKSILFVAMAQSIHTTRWIEQIAGEGHDIHLFSSQDNGTIHPLLKNITVYHSVYGSREKKNGAVKYRGLPIPGRFGVSLGYLARHALTRIHPTYQSHRLRRLVRRLKPDVVHSLEFQHSGYLTLDAKTFSGGKFPAWVATNWGSDIYLFGRLSAHEPMIRNLLASCDFYSCECRRDVALARSFGFKGEVLPVFPNTGGFNLEEIAGLRQPGPTSKRRLIMLKGYQGWAYRALVGLRALERCADILKGYTVAIYLGFTEEVRIAAELFGRSTGIPVKMIPYVSHEEMLRYHGQARVSIGLAISDAISTSFLEAMVMGSFPIQSNTACADEWIEDGKTGILVPPDDPDVVEQAIRRALTDDDLVDRAAGENWKTALERLDYPKIRPKAVDFYKRVFDRK